MGDHSHSPGKAAIKVRVMHKEEKGKASQRSSLKDGGSRENIKRSGGLEGTR
jgi:hypothetical protein